MSKRLFTITILVLTMVFCGCAANIMQRKDAHQAFPVAPKEFEDLKSYALITFQVNPILLEAEAGNAWYLILQYPNGKLEKHVAVQAELGEKHVFLAVVPNPAELKGILTGVHAVLLSHDAKYYFNASGEMFACPGKVKNIEWGKTATSLQGESAEEITMGSGEHEQILAWFREVTKEEVARRLNTTLTEDEYKILKKNSKGAKIATELAVNGATFGIIFGEVFAFTKSWEIALANATLTETIRLLSMLFQIGKPDFEFPEYGSGKVTRWELAEKIVTLQQLILNYTRQYTEVLNQYAKVTENSANALQQQEQEIKNLKEEVAALKEAVEILQEERGK
jgi:hypothetical protein